jgi:hypothetical protein
VEFLKVKPDAEYSTVTARLLKVNGNEPSK